MLAPSVLAISSLQLRMRIETFLGRACRRIRASMTLLTQKSTLPQSCKNLQMRTAAPGVAMKRLISRSLMNQSTTDCSLMESRPNLACYRLGSKVVLTCKSSTNHCQCCSCLSSLSRNSRGRLILVKMRYRVLLFAI